jgi:hypothetical protein
MKPVKLYYATKVKVYICRSRCVKDGLSKAASSERYVQMVSMAAVGECS